MDAGGLGWVGRGLSLSVPGRRRRRASGDVCIRYSRTDLDGGTMRVSEWHSGRRSRRLHVAVVAMAVAAGLSGCGGLLPTGTTGSQASAPLLTADLIAVQSATDDYLKGVTPEMLQTEPDRFFSEGRRLLGAVRAKQQTLAADVASANLPATSSPGYPSRQLVEQYSTALDAWVGAQEEQLANSEACWKSVDRESCYSSMLVKNSAKWQGAADKLNSALQSLQAFATSK